MKPNVSDHQFLEGDDIIVVQTSTTADYEKGDTKNVRVESLREDIRNYVESTTTKELKVFTSNRSVGGGRLDVLNNETLYYYPATPVSSLNDADISLTSNGDFFTDIDNQKEFNEKIYGFANDINLTLENSNKYLDAIVASTEFDDPDDPTEVVHFTNYNAYTTPNTDKAEVVNKNDLTYVDEESNKRDNDLQEQLDDQERRITALFNVKVDSGYYVHSTADPETTLPGPGQLHIDLTSNDVDPVTFSLHARSYTALYVGDEDPDNAQTTNNYIVVNPNDTIVTTNRTYKVVSVTVVDDALPVDERVFIIVATLVSGNTSISDLEFTTVRIVADGEFDPASLDGVYVKTTGDKMSGTLSVETTASTAIAIGGADSNPILTFGSDGSATTLKTTFGDSEFVTKAFVEEKLGDVDLSDVAPLNHTHDAAAIVSGKIAHARISTGTTSSTVAVGNHTHSGYASSSHTHSYAGTNHTHSDYVKSTNGQHTINKSGSSYFIS